MNQIRTRQDLIDHINKGNIVKYLFFWGHQKPKTGISKTCFSQWYEAPFEDNGILYPTAEHYMMMQKAKLFADEEMVTKIKNATHPGEAKKFGRLVKNFNSEIWEKNRFGIVVQANILKFSQNKQLKTFLLNTVERVIVEASPVDKIWGIGLTADNPNAQKPDQWKGENLLGFALMEVRERILEITT